MSPSLVSNSGLCFREDKSYAR